MRIIILIMNQTDGYLREEDHLGKRFLQERTGMSASHCYHVLRSLERKGMVINPSPGLYRVAPPDQWVLVTKAAGDSPVTSDAKAGDSPVTDQVTGESPASPLSLKKTSKRKQYQYQQKPEPSGVVPQPVKQEVAARDGKVYQAYENNIALLTSHAADLLEDAMRTYPLDWITDAIDLAVKYNKRNWAYCESILKRWQSEGRQTNTVPQRKTSNPFAGLEDLLDE